MVGLGGAGGGSCWLERKVRSPFCRLFALVSDVPRNFSVNLATKTSVLLTWEFPEGSNPYRFTVGAAGAWPRDGALTWWKLDFRRNLAHWLKILIDLICFVQFIQINIA